MWMGGANDEAELLRSCYRNSLQLAVDYELRTVAFPNISTGVYPFPKDRAARIAVEVVRAFAVAHDEELDWVLFVCFDAENFGLYQELLEG